MSRTKIEKGEGRDLTFTMDWEVFRNISALIKKAKTEIRMDLVFSDNVSKHICAYSMPFQTVSSSHVNISTNDIDRYYDYLVKEKGSEFANAMMNIGGDVHCHPGKSKPVPSGIDDADLEKVLNVNERPYYLKIIFNEDATEYCVIVAVRSDNPVFGESMQVYDGELVIIKPPDIAKGLESAKKRIESCKTKLSHWGKELKAAQETLEGGLAQLPDEILEAAEKELELKLNNHNGAGGSSDLKSFYNKQKKRQKKKKGEKHKVRLITCEMYPNRRVGSNKCRNRCKYRDSCGILATWFEKNEKKKTPDERFNRLRKCRKKEIS